MATVSLKERMKQLQVLKTSVQEKSQAALAREKELSSISQQSPAKSSNVGKLILETTQDDTTVGGETQTTAGETAASPLLPPHATAEDGETGTAPLTTTFSEAKSPSGVEDSLAPNAEIGEQHGSKGNAVPGEDDEIDDEVEIIEETQEVEGDTEGIEIEDVEEYVELFEDTDGSQEVEETVHDQWEDELVEEKEKEETEKDDTEKENTEKEETEKEDTENEETAKEDTEKEQGEIPEVADEMIDDEFAWGKRPIPTALSQPSDQPAEEAPMDEMEYLRRTRAQIEPAPSDYESESEEGLPVFQLLDEEAEQSSEEEEPFPIFQLLDAEELESTPTEQSRAPTEQNRAPTEQSRAPTEQSRALPQSSTHTDKSTVRPQVTVASAAAGASIDTGTGSNRSVRSGGVPKGFYDQQRRRWQFIFCCLLIVAAAAITALVLPFVLDDNDPELKTIPPTMSPAPTIQPSASPTMPPSISKAPTDAPSARPSTSPTVSPSPTDIPTQNPTNDPSPSPTPAPTRLPTQSPTGNPISSPAQSPTEAPVVPTDASTTAPAVITAAPVAPGPAPAVPTVSPALPTSPPVVPTNSPAAATGAPVAPTRAPVSVQSQEPTTLRLGNFIDVFLIPISGDEVFQDQSSPQFQAAVFLAEQDDYVIVGPTPVEIILAERYAIATFYFATGGENWNQCSAGDTTCFGPWLDGDVCDWDYLSCDDGGRIVSISFDGNYVDIDTVGLTGSIPPEIYVLENLEELIIINEPISGTLPTRFGTDAPNVRQVLIQGTEIGGEVPDGYLVNSPVESFVLSANNFNGLVPLNVGTPGTLTELDLSNNQLVGTLPGGLLRYVSLTSLSLHTNILQGTIPAGIYDMATLERLQLSNNPLLSGTLASSVGDMQSLIVLDLGDTGIGGQLPEELFTLPSLEELALRNARFRGTLPSTFSTLGDTLQRLFLQGNAFTGTVPDAFGELNQLSVLNLEGNNLVGSIPTQICELRGQNLDALTVDCDEVTCTCCTECFR